MVRSIRGAWGGYFLAKPPSEIKIKEIIQNLDGSFAPVDCVDDPEECSRIKSCVTRNVWTKLKEVLEGVLDSVSLEDLVKQQRENEKRSSKQVMYYI